MGGIVSKLKVQRKEIASTVEKAALCKGLKARKTGREAGPRFDSVGLEKMTLNSFVKEGQGGNVMRSGRGASKGDGQKFTP